MTDFLAIPKYEGFYEINTKGIVISLPRKEWNGTGYFISKREVLKPTKSKTGYLVIGLTKNKNPKIHYLHRLLAQTFIVNSENKKCINHKNGIKADNRLENLEWCTYKENSKHAFKNGLITVPNNPATKFTAEQVIKIRKLQGKEILRETANKFGISISHVWALQNLTSRRFI